MKHELSDTVQHLCSSFNYVTRGLPAARRESGAPNRLYRLQSEFAHYIHELTMSPPCLHPKLIVDAKQFIGDTHAALAQEAAAKSAEREAQEGASKA